MLGLVQARACTPTASNVDPTQLAWGSISGGPSGRSVDHHLCDTGYQAGAENGRLEPSKRRRPGAVFRGRGVLKTAGWSLLNEPEPLKLRRVNRELFEEYLADDTRRGSAPEGAFSGSAG